MIPQTPLYRNVRKMEKCVTSLYVGASLRLSIVVCLALVMVCALFLLTTVRAQASTVTINDQAGVLNAVEVQADAAQLPVPVLIYTTQTFTGDQDALNQFTREQLPDQNSIAIGIDTVHRNISIEAGTSVQLSDSQTSDAVSAFVSNYHGGDYTGATIAAIDSLKGALGSGGMSPLGVAVLILLGLVIVGLFVIARRQRRRDGSDGTPYTWNPYSGGTYSDGTYSRGIYPTGIPPSGSYGGGFGGGAGGSFGGGSSGGGAGGHF